ncbi:285_t:CDS:2 [Gigaspora margarita]|uniref:285_t:CDS:1 n=1 Tax=Gigaspora margarita TaxID=4874 RepID=A0ABM8W571_GIGMA|nr:285_t:CDS:2 [Gigaspora margarita]
MSFEKPSTTEYSKGVKIDNSCEGHENETNEPCEWSDNKNMEKRGNPGEGGGVGGYDGSNDDINIYSSKSPSRYKTKQCWSLKSFKKLWGYKIS